MPNPFLRPKTARNASAAEQAKLSKEECERLRVLGYVQSCDQVN